MPAASEHGGIVCDGVQVASTLQCPHCGAHFISQRGSGKRRAWCTRCRAVTCGDFSCDECIPLEARLEYAEGSKTPYAGVINELLAKGGIIL